MNPLYRKMFILSVSIAAFAVGMTYLLVLFKVQGTHRELRHGRFELIAKEIDRMIERSMALGLNFSELNTLPQALTRRQQADSAISRIDILDAKGKTVYSTETERIGQSTAAWAPALASAREGLWRYLGDEDAVAGSVVKNNFDVVEGYVAVRYSAAEGRATRKQLREGLTPVALIAFGASAAVLFLALSVLAWRFERDVRLASARLSGGESSATTLHGGWETLIAATAGQLADARKSLTAWREQFGTMSK